MIENEKFDLDFENEIKIDENILEVEWLNQASLASKYDRYWAYLDDKLTRAEDALSLLKAELITLITKDPSDYLGEGVKPTKDNVESAVYQDEEYQEKKEEVFNLKHQLNIAKKATEKMNMRKSALENLVKLHGQAYFSGPSIPHDISKEAQKKYDSSQSNRRIANKINRQRKRKISDDE